MAANPHVGEYFKLRVAFKQNGSISTLVPSGVALDISVVDEGTELFIDYRMPGGTWITVAATYAGDGTDGLAEYPITTELTRAGLLEYRGRSPSVALGGNAITDIATQQVDP